MLGLPQLIWKRKKNITSIMTSIIVYATHLIWCGGETIALHYSVSSGTKNVMAPKTPWHQKRHSFCPNIP